MGFGCGFGTAAKYGVATEKSRFAMPENNIGLFADAGFAYFAANKMTKGAGRLMALTGCHLIGAGDVIAAKLATHFVPFEGFPGLVEALKSANLSDDADAAIRGCIEGAAQPTPEPKIFTDSKLLDAIAAADFDGVFSTLADASDWAKETHTAAKKGCPFSQAVAWSLLTQAEADAASGMAEPGRLAAALERDFAAACRVLYRADFVEGVRAVLVDKDNAAKWQPATAGELNSDDVAAAVAPLAEGERRLNLV
eukprot:gnl/TRDRNA2_/TRDRNA2_90273_c0_seq3.p1 gnl/TRDRNA2_/TRDRNA2_90273_c0~~gnl/TRDRNA2_/TRDRNA2_90273_c0_seq3.p1  ORF type:complete len:253 (+),score=58.96 gnl/TRDRNA2_/TRDRNA2_90273_c0_seq3:72-830(+)